MSTEDIRRYVEETSPYLRKSGVRLKDVSATDAQVSLPPDPTNLNAAGQVHVGAIVTLAEAAATAAGLAALDQDKLTFSTKGAEVRYRRPAKGELVAHARLPHEACEEALNRAATEGKVDLPVPVAISEPAGERVAEATVILSLRRL